MAELFQDIIQELDDVEAVYFPVFIDARALVSPLVRAFDLQFLATLLLDGVNSPPPPSSSRRLLYELSIHDP